MATIPEALNLALQHHHAGRLPEAEALYRQVLQAQPDHPGALHLLGMIAYQVGRHEVAVEYVKQAIALNPAVAEFHNNLATVYFELNQIEAARRHLNTALQLQPGYAEALCNLADLLRNEGKLEEAEAHYRKALELKSDYAAVHNNLGLTLHNQGKPAEAVAHYQKALVLKPAFAEAHNNLGIALAEHGHLEEAVAHYQKALALKPAFAEAHGNLGNALKDQGRPEEAVAQYRQALALKPDHAAIHSNVLFCLQYCPASDAAALFAQHREWNAQHAGGLAATILPHGNRREIDRRLRIGYVSADFKEHPVKNFLEPVLAAHDKAQMQAYCYSMVGNADGVTVRMQADADHWRSIAGVSDADVAGLIRADEIDILVDLSGHTAGNRLPVFARKPAPVQATWIGYSYTTGLDAMDYLIADRFIAPPETAPLFTEQLARLPSCYLCYRPPDYAPPVSRCPARSKGYITFGCFNNLTKVNAEVIATWAQVLHAVPDARLVLKSRALSDRHTRERYGKLFLARGITLERVDLLGLKIPHADVLALYHEIDIALDTFPYSGCTTTCESLWMGVPVVTLAGQTFISRMGVSLLSNVGVPELIAESARHYVELAVQLSRDLDRVERLREGLRARMAASPLCDAVTFTHHLEHAYREMWKRWCGSGA